MKLHLSTQRLASNDLLNECYKYYVNYYYLVNICIKNDENDYNRPPINQLHESLS
jgi:hypothetical protein